MCICFEKMLERGYSEERIKYDEEKKEYIHTGEYIMKLLKTYLTVKHCPICGEKIVKP